MRGSVFYHESVSAVLEHNRGYQLHRKMLERIKLRHPRGTKIRLHGSAERPPDVSLESALSYPPVVLTDLEEVEEANTGESMEHTVRDGTREPNSEQEEAAQKVLAESHALPSPRVISFIDTRDCQFED